MTEQELQKINFDDLVGSIATLYKGIITKNSN
jgi:hypothetical protein